VKRSAATGREARYDSPEEMRAFQRVMRRVVSWLPMLDKHIGGREHQVIVVAVEGDDDRSPSPWPTHLSRLSALSARATMRRCSSSAFAHCSEIESRAMLRSSPTQKLFARCK
jgi:hypothetical protein